MANRNPERCDTHLAAMTSSMPYRELRSGLRRGSPTGRVPRAGFLGNVQEMHDMCVLLVLHAALRHLTASGPYQITTRHRVP